MRGFLIVLAVSLAGLPTLIAGEDPRAPLALEDIFELEYASDPRISPDGERIVYVRNFMDVMSDRRRSNLWLIRFDGSEHRPLTTGLRNDSSPRWSPDGKQLLFRSTGEDGAQLELLWIESGHRARLSRLTGSPGNLAWSPDGNSIAFSMHQPDQPEPLASLPKKPEGAAWAEPAKVIRSLLYRADGRGYLKQGTTQLFVIPADGGTPRALTSGPYDHPGPYSWTPDGQSILVSARRTEQHEYDPVDSEIHAVPLDGGPIVTLTDRRGPDRQPLCSPDGEWIAYLGFDDRVQGYQVVHPYLMRRDGSDSRGLDLGLDRSIRGLAWDGSGRLHLQYDDQGNTGIARVGPAGLGGSNVAPRRITGDVGGTSLGRPYSGGSFSVAGNGRIAFTLGRTDRPADVAVVDADGGEPRRLTALNEDLLGHRSLGAVEELWTESSFDGRRIQAWVVRPPGFDPAKEYPLVLEIHGGPFANYGDRFSAECQLYAAAGYVVVYANPRGSSSYGEEFGNLIHHNYPGEDYDDLMSVVDAVIANGSIDADRLYVTGGSGGGVLSSWIVGKTDRFRAAVVAKPVINWTSFALTADNYNFYYKYWFPGFPWDHQEHYWKRSPLSLVGNVTTPTMLLTGEQDHRTPITESEQFYQALKLRRVDTALVRIPGASHGIAARPSHLISKVAHVLAWFEQHGE